MKDAGAKAVRYHLDNALVTVSEGEFIPYKELPPGWEKFTFTKEWYKPELERIMAIDTITVTLHTKRGSWRMRREGTLQQVMKKMIDEEDVNDLLEDTERVEFSRA